jgi:hypothetical protein
MHAGDCEAFVDRVPVEPVTVMSPASRSASTPRIYADRHGNTSTMWTEDIADASNLIVDAPFV